MGPRYELEAEANFSFLSFVNGRNARSSTSEKQCKVDVVVGEIFVSWKTAAAYSRNFSETTEF